MRSSTTCKWSKNRFPFTRVPRVPKPSTDGATPRIDHQDATNVDSKGIAFTIRSVFIIDPKKTIRTILSYPASTGRNTAEVLRIVDSLQTGDKNKVTTPINWLPGDDVIVHPSIKGAEAEKMFPKMTVVKPYLRFTPLPREETSATK